MEVALTTSQRENVVVCHELFVTYLAQEVVLLILLILLAKILENFLVFGLQLTDQVLVQLLLFQIMLFLELVVE